MNALQAQDLHLWRGEQHVLRGVCLQVGSGQCLQVTGANGAGKTTLLRALSGLVPLEEGRVLWGGRDVATDRAGYQRQLEYLGHDNSLKADLTSAENLRCLIQLKRRIQPAEITAALSRTGVLECATALTRRLSAGQRRRVALARLLLSEARLWLLDEPTANLDQRGHALLAELLAGHLATGGMAVVATHHPLTLSSAQLLSLALQ